MLRTVTTFAVGLAFAVAAAPALAQDETEPAKIREATQAEIAAEALFQEAVALREKGQWEQACATFRASQRLASARGTLLNIAECDERFGDIASAWTEYTKLQDLALAAGDQERLEIARRKIRELEPRLPRVTIRIADDADVDGLHVTLDGMRVDSTLAGVSLPVDAGEHVVRATAPGHEPWEDTVAIAERETRDIVVPRLGAVAAAPDTGTPSDAAAGAPAAVRTRSRARITGYTVAPAYERPAMFAVYAEAGFGATDLGPTSEPHGGLLIGASYLRTRSRFELGVGGELGRSWVPWDLEQDSGTVGLTSLLVTAHAGARTTARSSVFARMGVGLRIFSGLERGSALTDGGFPDSISPMGSHMEVAAGAEYALGDGFAARLTALSIGYTSAPPGYRDSTDAIVSFSGSFGLVYRR